MTDAPSPDRDRSAAEIAALRRVAALVARGPAQAEIFEAVVTEVGLLFPGTDATLVRLHRDETATLIGRWNELTGYRSIDVRHPFHPGTLARSIWGSPRPSRVATYANWSGSLAEVIRSWGWTSSVGAPVTVNAEAWGLTAVGSTNGEDLPPGAEERLAAFTELLTIAIANAEGREEIERLAAGLAAERAALRRVAELVSHDVPLGEVLGAVVTEVGSLVGVASTTLVRFEPDGAREVVAVNGPTNGVAVGLRASAESDGAIQRVHRTGRPARADRSPGLLVTSAQPPPGHRFTSSAAVPIWAEDQLWGALVVAGRADLPPQIEEKLARFSELAGTAILSSQAHTTLQTLVDEQAALLRVAEQVARGTPSDEVFAAVAAEAQQLLDGRPMTFVRFEDDETLTVVSRSDGPTPPGIRIAYSSGTLPDRVRRTAKALRIDDFRADANAALARRHDLTAGAAAPIVVQSRVWGMLAATSDQPLTGGVVERLQRLANLVGAAVSNETSRAQLVASRARVLSTADEARRRLQRDVHDGAQQRLVHTVITLELARHSLARGDVPAAVDHVNEALKHAHRATDQVREIVSGILPAALTRSGLRGGVESLLADQPLPVDAAVEVPRMSTEVETTAYFVIAEALTNVVKHAGAGRAWVLVDVRAGTLRIEVGDDGVGGARAADGSGLTGLFDRVEALGGQLRVVSPLRRGTKIEVTLPVGEPRSATPARVMRYRPAESLASRPSSP